MAETTLHNVELNRVNEDGTVDTLYPATAAKNVVIKSDDNPNLAGFSNAQDVFSHLSASAFGAGSGDTLLLASNWVGGKYSLEDKYPSDTYDVEIEAGNTMSYRQSVAWKEANVVGSSSQNIMTATGTVPSIDIPVIVKATERS